MAANYRRAVQAYAREANVGPDLLRESAAAYARFLRAHMDLETTQLFPAIEARLSAADDQAACQEFDRIEREEVGPGRHAQFHHMISTLATRIESVMVADQSAAGPNYNQDEGAATTVVPLDVRPLTPREKHPAIFRTFNDLTVGSALRLVNDHDPVPLFYQFQAERAGQFEWLPQQQGPEVWVIDIRKTG